LSLIIRILQRRNLAARYEKISCKRFPRATFFPACHYIFRRRAVRGSRSYCIQKSRSTAKGDAGARPKTLLGDGGRQSDGNIRTGRYNPRAARMLCMAAKDGGAAATLVYCMARFAVYAV
jgi:hypothetical protein